jgi:hypothetical protein
MLNNWQVLNVITKQTKLTFAGCAVISKRNPSVAQGQFVKLIVFLLETTEWHTRFDAASLLEMVF